MNTFSQPHSIQNTFCEFVQFFVNSKYVFVNLVIVTNWLSASYEFPYFFQKKAFLKLFLYLEIVETVPSEVV